MNKLLISRILSVIVILGALAVMFGWFFGIEVLKSVVVGWTTMKFITALSFFVGGILLFLLSMREKGELTNLFILIISFTLFLLMVTFFISLFLGVSTGLENWFVKDTQNIIGNSRPGVPGVLTMIGFMLLGLAGLVSILDSKGYVYLPWIGGLISFLGSLAIVGYIFDIDQLYDPLFGFTSTSFHAALLFVLVGIVLILNEGAKK